MGTWIVLGMIAVAVIVAVFYMIRNKRNGRSISCGGDCSHCGMDCHKQGEVYRERRK